MIRFKLYYDKDKETVWLNQMASEGWALKSFFAGFYKFEPCGKGEYIYQIDLGDTLYSVSDEYRELMGNSAWRSSCSGDTGSYCANGRLTVRSSCIQMWNQRLNIIGRSEGCSRL